MQIAPGRGRVVEEHDPEAAHHQVERPRQRSHLDVGQQRLDRRATDVVCRCGVTRVSLGDSPFELGDHRARDVGAHDRAGRADLSGERERGRAEPAARVEPALPGPRTGGGQQRSVERREQSVVLVSCAHPAWPGDLGPVPAHLRIRRPGPGHRAIVSRGSERVTPARACPLGWPARRPGAHRSTVTRSAARRRLTVLSQAVASMAHTSASSSSRVLASAIDSRQAVTACCACRIPASRWSRSKP